jgi:hypothetical protein
VQVTRKARGLERTMSIYKKKKEKKRKEATLLRVIKNVLSSTVDSNNYIKLGYGQ